MQVSSGDDHVSIKVRASAVSHRNQTRAAIPDALARQQSGMDLPGISFNMASQRIVIEHNLFETVCVCVCVCMCVLIIAMCQDC